MRERKIKGKTAIDLCELSQNQNCIRLLREEFSQSNPKTSKSPKIDNKSMSLKGTENEEEEEDEEESYSSPLESNDKVVLSYEKSDPVQTWSETETTDNELQKIKKHAKPNTVFTKLKPIESEGSGFKILL